MESYSLLELNQYIKRVFALNFADAIWISCEISQVKSSRGNYYLDLIQKHESSEEVVAQNQAVIWFKSASFLKKKLGKLLDSILSDGVQILIKVKLDFHERYGLKLVIEDIDPTYTIGQLEINRQQILGRLKSENKIGLNGLIEMNPVLQRIAVISSETAAGYQDFYQQLIENSQGYQYYIELYPAAMQGIKVEKEVCQQLNEINSNREKYDLVCILRGGGSKMDLSGFDNYLIGQTIAEMNLPVITGIGHDIDDTIADAVAHTALKTPTAVADFIQENNLYFESSILDLSQFIQQTSNSLLTDHKHELKYLQQWLTMKPLEYIRDANNELVYMEQEIKSKSKDYISRQKMLINHLKELIEFSSPQKILNRGFSIVRSGGKLIHSAKAINKGTELETEFSDGSIKSKVI